MTLSARAKAVADLRQAILALGPHLRQPEEAAELSGLLALADRLSQQRPVPPAGLADFDPERFRHLLELAGPGMAAQLLAQLIADLGQCKADIQNAARIADWDGLRQSSHVLVSLAGSVGAMSLHGQAEALNALANAQDGRGLKALVPPLLAELDALIALVRQTEPPRGDLT